MNSSFFWDLPFIDLEQSTPMQMPCLKPLPHPLYLCLFIHMLGDTDWEIQELAASDPVTCNKPSKKTTGQQATSSPAWLRDTMDETLSWLIKSTGNRLIMLICSNMAHLVEFVPRQNYFIISQMAPWNPTLTWWMTMLLSCRYDKHSNIWEEPRVKWIGWTKTHILLVLHVASW